MSLPRIQNKILINYMWLRIYFHIVEALTVFFTSKKFSVGEYLADNFNQILSGSVKILKLVLPQKHSILGSYNTQSSSHFGLETTSKVIRRVEPGDGHSQHYFSRSNSISIINFFRYVLRIFIQFILKKDYMLDLIWWNHFIYFWKDSS